jgi:hypothetical protein
MPLAVAPGVYVASAYGVFVAMLVVYLAIIGPRLRRTRRQLAALSRELEEREP